MNLSERLRSLKEQQNRKRIELERQQREEERQRQLKEQAYKQRVIELQRKADSIFRPILDTVNKEWVGNKGEIQIRTQPVPSLEYGAGLSLIWDKSGNYRGLQYHEIKLKLDSIGNIKVYGGEQQTLLVINLNDDDWLSKVEDDIVGILDKDLTGVYHHESLLP